jgi:putative thioredoxin
MTDVDEATFEDAVIGRSHERPVVVDFWAEWCGPCRTLGPVLETEIDALAGQVELAKVDIDANPALAARFDVRSIPAVKAFRNGHVVNEFLGAQPPARVRDFLTALTGPSELDRVLAELREQGEEPEAVAALERGDTEGALELLLERVAAADEARRERIRQLMLAVFADLGAEHPLTTTYRRRLATALY